MTEACEYHKHATARRNHQDWVLKCANAVVGSKAPEIFRRWASLAIVGAALGRRCYYDQGSYQVRPNLYVVLVGGPTTGKGISIDLPTDIHGKLALHVGLDPRTEAGEIAWKGYVGPNVDPMRVMEGYITYPMLSQQLDNISHVVENSVEVMDEASLLVVSSEFGLFMSRYEQGLHNLLTEGWDSRNKAPYLTKNKGVDIVKGPCISWLAAATPQQFIACMPQEANEQGLLSRIIPVVYDGPGGVPEMKVEGRDNAIVEELAMDLGRIYCLTGQFHFEDQAMLGEIDQWLQDGQHPCPTDPAFGQYMGRRHSHLLKMSMCISASRRSDMLITRSDWQTALDWLVEVEQTMPLILKRFSMSETGRYADRLVDYIKETGKHTPLGIMIRVSHLKREALRLCKTSSEVDTVLELLVSSGYLEREENRYFLKEGEHD